MQKHSGKILVVDDDRLLREFYSRVFDNMGYEVVCAADGQQAIDFLENAENGFSLVLMDLLMPVKTGWEAIDYIRGRQEWRDLPVIAITGLSMSKHEIERVREQCNEIICKDDFEMKTFERLVAQYVDPESRDVGKAS